MLAPLHHVHMYSKLVTGFVLVAVSTTFPVDGPDFVMANNIAGGKIYPLPEAVNVPIVTPEP